MGDTNHAGGATMGLYYYKMLHIMSPQRSGCYTVPELARFKVGELDKATEERMAYHLGQFRCKWCNDRLDEFEDCDDAHEVIERCNNPTDLPASYLARVARSGKKFKGMEKLNFLAQKIKDMRILKKQSVTEEQNPSRKLEIGQIWLSTLSIEAKKYQMHHTISPMPAMWPLLITDIDSQRNTIKIMPISPDYKMHNENITYSIESDDYCTNGLIEIFNEITATKNCLQIYKGNLSEDHLHNVVDMRHNENNNFILPEHISDWMGREIKISKFLSEI